MECIQICASIWHGQMVILLRKLAVEFKFTLVQSYPVYAWILRLAYASFPFSLYVFLIVFFSLVCNNSAKAIYMKCVVKHNFHISLKKNEVAWDNRNTKIHQLS